MSTHDPELVEVVAEAIYEHTNMKPTVDGIAATWEQYKENISPGRSYLVEMKQTAFDQARAALDAMDAWSEHDG